MVVNDDLYCSGTGRDGCVLGHRWKSWCCECGAPIYTVFTYPDTPAAPLLHPDPDTPKFTVRQRCDACHKAGLKGPTGMGFTVRARRALASAGGLKVEGLMHRPPLHYVVYRHQGGPRDILSGADIAEHDAIMRIRRLTILTSLL